MKKIISKLKGYFAKDISLERFLELTQLKFDESSFKYKHSNGSWICMDIVIDAQKRKDLSGLASELLRNYFMRLTNVR